MTGGGGVLVYASGGALAAAERLGYPSVLERDVERELAAGRLDRSDRAGHPPLRDGAGFVELSGGWRARVVPAVSPSERRCWLVLYLGRVRP